MFCSNPSPSGARRPCSLGVQQDVGTGQQAVSGAISGFIGYCLPAGMLSTEGRHPPGNPSLADLAHVHICGRRLSSICREREIPRLKCILLGSFRASAAWPGSVRRARSDRGRSLWCTHAPVSTALSEERSNCYVSGRSRCSHSTARATPSANWTSGAKPNSRRARSDGYS